MKLWDKLDGLPSEMRGPVTEMMKKEPIYGRLAHQVMPSPEFVEQYTMKYIEMSQHPEDYKVPQVEIDYAKERLLATVACNADDDAERFRSGMEFVEETWEFAADKMKENPGYFHFQMDNGGLDSGFMYRFYHDIPGTVSPAAQARLKPEHRSNPALQMDTAFGYYRDIFGDYRSIPSSDPAMRQCIQELLWTDPRSRVPIYNYYGKLVGKGAKITELCGGTLQSFRRCGYLDENLQQEITVYDSNPLIQDVLPIVFEKPIADYGIRYYYDSFVNAAKNPDLQGTQHLVRIQGGMSYFVPQTVDSLRLSRFLLMSGGYCTFDRQIANLSLKKCISVLGHNMPGANMQPDKDVPSAIRNIEAAVAEAGGFKIELAVSNEKFNAPLPATNVQFTLRAI